MIYPQALTSGSTIAITAFSAGVTRQQEPRFNAIVKGLENRGFSVIVGSCLQGNTKHVSAPANERAQELVSFLLDERIDAIAPPWGGELAMELLPLIDFKNVQQAQPKWVFGFSDVSTLSAVITSKLNWASAHCSNLMDLIPSETNPLLANTLHHLALHSNQGFTQHASLKHTRHWPAIEKDPMASLITDTKTQWQWLVKPTIGDVISGRLIGGCWDTLLHLFDTEYLDLRRMQQSYPEGILLYLENVEMSPANLTRAILSMKFRGVFKYINGLVLGRSFYKDSDNPDHLTYIDVLNTHLSNLHMPVMYDLDIGHAPPNLTLINGALATITLNHQHAHIHQTLC